jgi:hypothetical protein
MNASEARKLSKEARDGIVIQPYLDIIHDLISEKAKEGLYALKDPFASIESISRKRLTEGEKEAIKHALNLSGYIMIYHQNPEPCNSCSRAYTSVNW